ncbi:type II secretion system major pseudopilin GspG [Kangiella koreensis]|uniref:Type II secretion system core protein G n=1 Tax=Kangiella koreensis (strain DSM 16069 / JCM 12317 / KCTC 12182 / SW-125) TaxID=523791 RepID=C7R8F7_KANKD|nr:type II secretion system major pseudopilin GspG [Kangiella koreensis]ACV27722.1 general secretion pathway protein G [Kangiella koreensis DSM 16069]
MKRILRKQKGFTLTEILIALAIVAIMGTVVTLSLLGNTDKANLQKLKSDLGTIEMALQNYKLDNGYFPTTEQGLRALIEKPSTNPVPQNYPRNGYLGSRAIPTDPWKREYVYMQPGRNHDYDLYTLGADGRPGGDGENMDISPWNVHEANFNRDNQ